MNVATALALAVPPSAAITGLVVTYLLNLRLARRKDQLDGVTNQLRDFYGPLLALVSAAEKSWQVFRSQYRPNISYWDERLPPTDADKEAWRSWLVTVFMPLNRQMRDLVVTKAHLINGSEMPECLLALAAHVSAYEPILARWETGDLSLHAPPFSFPRRVLLEYAKCNFATLKARQQELLLATARS